MEGRGRGRKEILGCDVDFGGGCVTEYAMITKVNIQTPQQYASYIPR